MLEALQQTSDASVASVLSLKKFSEVLLTLEANYCDRLVFFKQQGIACR